MGFGWLIKLNFYFVDLEMTGSIREDKERETERESAKICLCLQVSSNIQTDPSLHHPLLLLR